MLSPQDTTIVVRHKDGSVKEFASFKAMEKAVDYKRREYYLHCRLESIDRSGPTIEVPIYQDYWPTDHLPQHLSESIKTGLNEVGLRLIAFRYGWVLEFVEKAIGINIGEFHVESLIGFGAEKLVFRSKSISGEHYALKLPWHPRSRCSEPDEMEKRTQQLEQEAWLLQRFPFDAFPKYKALLFADSLIPSSAPPGRTPYLVEELIEGKSVGRSLHMDNAFKREEPITDIAIKCLRTLVETGLKLAREGFLYTDYGQDNIILSGHKVRIVDVGSISFMVSGKVRQPRVTLSSLPVAFFQRYISDPNNYFIDECGALACIGRLIGSILCEQHLSPGVDLTWAKKGSSQANNIFSLAQRLALGEVKGFDNAWAAISKFC